MSDVKVDSYGWSEESRPPSESYLHPEIMSIISGIKPTKVLDLGCGNGDLCKLMHENGHECIGVDADEQGIDVASKKYPDIKFIATGVYDDPGLLQDEGIDFIVSAEVVEHLFKPSYLPKYAARLLEQGQHLVVTTPYHGYLKNLLLSILDKWDSHHTVLWEGGHIKFWSRTTLQILLEREGFEILSFKGIGRFPYLWKSMMIVARKI